MARRFFAVCCDRRLTAAAMTGPSQLCQMGVTWPIKPATASMPKTRRHGCQVCVKDGPGY
ncbi:hypothetical protein I553_8801 [Mycobacterium xenopi 4042]|uniref:Uncharacterized protein n=1 Tax=Mycobacterium xenopi 4042 TaxID=1299334 RepID=X8CK48_MYCXE|nr:hypothetical protein I553_8801 [Mycobacterium xenopi 4042]